MRSIYIGIISGTAGALIGAAAMYHLAGNNPPTVASPASANQAQALPRDQKTDIPVASAGANWVQDSTAARRLQPAPSTSTEPSLAAPPGAEKKKPDPAEEEATVQVVMSRFYDPTMNLTGIMQSEEMLKLSDESRERVVAKLVEMLNRGEINAQTFMAGGNSLATK